MFKAIEKIAANDTAIKLLFDHVRNVGICAVVFGAAVWKSRNLGPEYVFYLDWFIIFLLVSLGIILFVINQFHAINKLKAIYEKSWRLNAILNIYSLIAVSIIFSLLGIKI